MLANDIRDYFRKHAPWVNWRTTVDNFKCGDPAVEVRRIAVTWMLTVEAVARVRRLRANLVVTHEPTFFTHHDDLKGVKDDPAYKRKRALLERAGLTILRIHDSWDNWPTIGIGDSLATLLQLGAPVAQSKGLARTYRIRPLRLDRFAAFVRRKLKMDCAGVAGDGSRTVRRVGLAYGAQSGVGPMRAFASMKPDVVLAGETCNWQDVRYFQDCGIAVIVTDHAASENPGMRNLAKFLTATFGVPADFVEVGPSLRAIT